MTAKMAIARKDLSVIGSTCYLVDGTISVTVRI